MIFGHMILIQIIGHLFLEKKLKIKKESMVQLDLHLKIIFLDQDKTVFHSWIMIIIIFGYMVDLALTVNQYVNYSQHLF